MGIQVASALLIASLLPAQKPRAEWQLAFADEFDGNTLDLSRWAPHDPSGPAPAVLNVSGGQLHLSKGAISTFGLFAQLYGRFEIRCRVPAGSGLTAAFRLLPVPLARLPGIDVFEAGSRAPLKAEFSNRWGTDQTERSYGDSLDVPDLSAGFHIFAVEWDKDKIVWSIDGKERLRSTDGIPHQSMFPELELNAVSPVASFDIDYIRIYRRP